MNSNFSGKKRKRSESPLICKHCELCEYRFNEIILMKEALNDKIYELNKLIESIHYRFNEKGDILSYIK
jgi:hypothetical protein